MLAVPATTTIRGIPTQVPLDQDDGTPVHCVLALDNIGLIRRSLCTQRITRLDPIKMQAVCAALQAATAW